LPVGGILGPPLPSVVSPDESGYRYDCVCWYFNVTLSVDKRIFEKAVTNNTTTANTERKKCVIFIK